MEGLLNSLLNQSFLKPGFTPKFGCTFPLIARSCHFNLKNEPHPRRSDCTFLGRETAASSRRTTIAAFDRDDERKESSMDWESEFIGELDPYGCQAPKKRKKEQKSKLLEETDGMDWCMRARKIALKSIEARGMAHTMEDLISC